MSKNKERLIDDNMPLVRRKMILKNRNSVLIESVNSVVNLVETIIDHCQEEH